MDSPFAVILAGLLVAAAGWAIPYYTLKGNNGVQSALLLDVVRKAEGEQYSRRLQLLEDDNKLIRQELAKCQDRERNLLAARPLSRRRRRPRPAV